VPHCFRKFLPVEVSECYVVRSFVCACVRVLGLGLGSGLGSRLGLKLSVCVLRLLQLVFLNFYLK
jgi:hypothetical protein